jgi:hypothetical protein
MSITETPPDAPKHELRWYQFSLRAIFVLTSITAVFFSVARTLGYADAVVALAAFVVLVGVVAYPRRVHLTTGILLTLVAGTLLWANLRPTRWERLLDELPPDQLDVVTKGMFYRGWPLSPFMLCWRRHMHFDPGGDGLSTGALVLDGVVFAAALFVVRGVSELCFRRRGKPIDASARMPPPQSDPPPGGAGHGSMVN